jgi:hypothetical protein
MKRRALLLLPLAACCRAADPAQEVVDLVADAAASLSAGNVALFLKAFDPAMTGYAKLRENVTGLISQGELQSFIDPLEDEGDARRRAVQFRWTCVSYGGSGPVRSAVSRWSSARWKSRAPNGGCGARTAQFARRYPEPCGGNPQR